VEARGRSGYKASIPQHPGDYLFAGRLEWIGIPAQKQSNDESKQAEH